MKRPSPQIDLNRERRWVLRIMLGLLTVLCIAGTAIIALDPKTVGGGHYSFAFCALVFASSLALSYVSRCPLQIPIATTIVGGGALLLLRISMVLSSEAVYSGALSAFNPIFGYVTIYFALLAVLLPPRWCMIAAGCFWLLVAGLTSYLTRNFDPAVVEALPALKLFVWVAYPMIIALIFGAVQIVQRAQAFADHAHGDLESARAELAMANKELEQRIAERTLELQQEREALKAVLENVSEGIVACTSQGRMSVINPAARSMLGDPDDAEDPAAWAEQLKARTLTEDGAPLPLWRALSGESVRDAPIRVQLGTGKAMDLMVNASPLHQPGQSDHGAVASFRDVTEQQRQQEDLQRSNQALEQFAYAVSHDLQAPLRSIAGFAQLLERRHKAALEDSGQEYLDFITQGVGNMQGMIDGLLALSRYSAQEVLLQPVDLNNVIQSALSHFAGDTNFAAAEIEVAPLPTVESDEALLITVFQNLIANSLKFSEGPQRLRIFSERDDVSCRIHVQDQGVGFAPDQAEELFRLFRRVGDVERFTGHGIGLCTCRQILERLQGSISAQSDGPGLGATMTVKLPLAAPSI